MAIEITCRSRNYRATIRDFTKNGPTRFADLDIMDGNNLVVYRFDSIQQIYEFGKKIETEAEILINQETREQDKMIGEMTELDDYREAKGR